ncbi:MAG: hypothetical protein HQK49_02425 [Oligoflexia bacterium]|nr:hypothetical protein [Oligoflexia bacterium]
MKSYWNWLYIVVLLLTLIWGRLDWVAIASSDDTNFSKINKESIKEGLNSSQVTCVSDKLMNFWHMLPPLNFLEIAKNKILSYFDGKDSKYNLPISGVPICVAHRAQDIDSRNFKTNEIMLENSMQTLKDVVENSGATYLEFDIRHTKDGIPIVVHNKTLAKVAKSKGMKEVCPLHTPVSKLDLSAIRKNCMLNNGEEIHTLEEFLEYTSSKNVHPFVELKDEPSINTIKTVRKFYSRKKGMTIISFKENYLQKFKSTYKTGLKNKNFFQLRLLNGKISPTMNGIDVMGINAAAVMNWHRNNKSVCVWTVNSENLIRENIKKGVDFITTDRYSLCQKLVNEEIKRRFDLIKIVEK